MPVTVGVQVIRCGNVVAVPILVLLAKNWTPAIEVPDSVAPARAVTELTEPTATLPARGAVRLTVGALPPPAVTPIAAEVVVAPALSVATAVRV